MVRLFCTALFLSLALVLPLRADPVSALSPDGARLAQARDNTVTVTDVGTNKQLMAIRAHAADVTALAFSPDDKLLVSADGKGVIHMFDTATGKALRKTALGTGVGKLAFSNDGRVLKITDAAGKEANLDVATGKLIK